MMLVALLFVIVFALAINAAITGHYIGWLLVGIMAVGAYIMYDDAMTIIDEEGKQ
jgi:hypothetical protein